MRVERRDEIKDEFKVRIKKGDAYLKEGEIYSARKAMFGCVWVIQDNVEHLVSPDKIERVEQ